MYSITVFVQVLNRFPTHLSAILIADSAFETYLLHSSNPHLLSPNQQTSLERKSLTSKMVHLKALLLVGHSWPFLFTMIICMQYLQTVKS
jgi:hypothetical protein